MSNLTDMSEWIPGVTCDVILQHYKYEALPLVCWRIQSDPIGPRVRTHFETYWPTTDDGGRVVSRDEKPITVRHLWFTVLCTDEMLYPDGGWYPLAPAEIRMRLNQILTELTDMTLYTQSGIITGLYSDEHAIIDTIYQNAHTIEINLTTRQLHDIPIGPEQADMWLPVAVLDPYSTWGTAVWR